MDFFELLAQGADDANKKDGKNDAAKGVTSEPEKVEAVQGAADSRKAEREAEREAKRLEKEAAREAKYQEKLQQRADKEEAREQKRLEREAAAEMQAAETQVAAGVDAVEADAEHDDPRAALAALLAGTAAADALTPEAETPKAAPTETSAATSAVTPVAAPEEPAVVVAAEPPVTEPFDVPKESAEAARPAEAVEPTEAVDPVKKYEWTAPMPTAASAAVGAGTAAAAAGQSAGAAGGNGSGSNGSGGDDSGRKQRAIAWSVVAGILVLVAIGAAVIAIPAVNNNAQPTPSPTKTSESPTPTPSPTKTSESPSPTPTPTPTTPVDVGPTTPLDVPPWGVTFNLATKFGSTQWQITGNTLTMDNTLVNSFPESCAALRTGWGVTKANPPAQNGVVVGGNAYNLAKPSGTCQANPTLYNEVLGLTQAMVNTAKVLP